MCYHKILILLNNWKNLGREKRSKLAIRLVEFVKRICCHFIPGKFYLVSSFPMQGSIIRTSDFDFLV